MANIQNLKPWKPGESGNPAGKPKGTKHLSKWIQEALEDDGFESRLTDGTLLKGMPIKAILNTLILKSLDGDLKAIDILAKYGYGSKIDLTSDYKELPTPILGGFTSEIRKTPLP